MAEYRDIGERFMRYASICTQSEEGHTETPSTERQRTLAELLAGELRDMGASDVVYDEAHCYVYAEVPGNLLCGKDDEKRPVLEKRPDAKRKRRENLAPVIGLMAHMDTSDAVKGLNVRPRRVEHYDGKAILLGRDSDGQEIVLDPAVYPSLKRHVGKTLIVTDGTTVLGGDDKAGVAAIMEMANFYLHHPEYAHGTIRICFTPDEEVGNGTAYIDLDRFACDYAYTVDGGEVGELSYENFNAASADLVIRGIPTHPGDAKGRMRNALLAGMELNSLLPPLETPFYTEGYEGFFHLTEMKGTEEKAELHYIIRDHDRKRFEERKTAIRKAAETINARYGDDETVSLSIRDSYYNMYEKIAPQRHLVDNAVAAMRDAGVEPQIRPIRGGTDGCQLSFRGIPCPNLGTGSYNYHSRYEYVCVEEMQKNAEILVRILNKYASYELDA